MLICKIWSWLIGTELEYGVTSHKKLLDYIDKNLLN